LPSWSLGAQEGSLLLLGHVFRLYGQVRSKPRSFFATQGYLRQLQVFGASEQRGCKLWLIAFKNTAGRKGKNYTGGKEKRR